MIEIVRLKTAEDVAEEAAAHAGRALAAAQQSHKLATFVLAGGRLPPVASRILAEKYAQAFDWSRVLFLIGDERCVPLNHPDSSWLAALPMFAARPEVPKEHQLRPQSDLSAEEAAAAYANTLLSLPLDQAGRPILHHIWLGIGEDGHTLSLFPNRPSPAQKLVIGVHGSPKPPPDRISLTYKALEGAQSAVVFISGASKAPIVAQIAQGDHALPVVQASRVIAKAGGHVVWLVDDEAASGLPAPNSTNWLSK